MLFACRKNAWGQFGRDDQEAQRRGGKLKFFEPGDAGFECVEEMEFKSTAVELKCQAVGFAAGWRLTFSNESPVKVRVVVNEFAKVYRELTLAADHRAFTESDNFHCNVRMPFCMKDASLLLDLTIFTGGQKTQF